MHSAIWQPDLASANGSASQRERERERERERLRLSDCLWTLLLLVYFFLLLLSSLVKRTSLSASLSLQPSRSVALADVFRGSLARMPTAVRVVYTVCARPPPAKWWLEELPRSFIRLVTLSYDLGTTAQCHPWYGHPSCQFWCFCEFSLSSYGQTCVKLTTWRDLDLWPLSK